MGFMSDMFKGSGGTLVGGSLGAVAGLINQNSANNHAMAVANMNAALQKEFAQNSIKWRVEDAKRAGVHPMAALGISPSSFSPVSAPFTSNGLEDILSNMGQNVDRAALAAKTAEDQQAAKDFDDKLNALRLRNMELQNDALSAEIESKHARIRQMNVPSAPKVNISQPFGDQPDAPFKAPSFKPGTTPLLQLSRVGNTLISHINSDISDSITEDVTRNILANANAEFQAGRITPEVLHHLTPDERRLIKKGDITLEYDPPSTWRIRYTSRMKPKYSSDKKEVSGKLNEYHMRY